MPATVPSVVGLSAYRIVQEALSNASRHAPGAAVTIDLRGDGRALSVRVENGPGVSGVSEDRPGVSGVSEDPPQPVAGPSHPHGLVGMRERIAMLGGEFTAGPTAGGGFALWATLPLSGEGGR